MTTDRRPKGRLETMTPEQFPVQSALDTIRERPLSDPTINAIITAAKRAGAYPVLVHWHGRVHEIAVWHGGEWVGSVFRWPGGGLGAWCSVGNRQAPAASPEAAVRTALGATVEGRFANARTRQDGAEALPHTLVASSTPKPCGAKSVRANRPQLCASKRPLEDQPGTDPAAHSATLTFEPHKPLPHETREAHQLRTAVASPPSRISTPSPCNRKELQ